MASLSAFASLAPPVTDDNMEMSSPANQPLDDDDIDIDFDDYADGVHVDDEQMVEDAQARPGTGTDDMMEDDVLPAEQAILQEEVMHDDDGQAALQEDEDDELIDYGEEDFHEDAHENTILPPVARGETEQANHTDAHPPGVAVAEVTEGTAGIAPAQEVSSPAEVLPPSSVIAEEAVYAEPGDDAPHTTAEVDSAAVDTGEQDLTNEARENPHDGTVADNAESTEDSTPGTPTDTGLHPMMVRYGDLRIPLFKSRRQPDGLLKDDNLASLSLAELMKNCRQRLAIKIGEDLSEDQELHLGFDRLGLLLVENSRVAFESSLNDILEVYLQLQQNDGLDEIPPLSLTLSLQLKFASSLSILRQAAANGQGMSTFGFLNVTEGDEYYQEQYEYGEDVDFPGNEGGQERVNTRQVNDTANNQDTGHADTTEDFQAYDETEGVHGEFEGVSYHEEETYSQEESTGHTYELPSSGIETILQGEQPTTHTLYNAPDEPAAVDNEESELLRSADRAESAHQLLDQANSTASSTTVEGDPAVDNTSEYDSIDWDEDALTFDISATTSAQQDDFSTFLTEVAHDEAAEQATAKNVEQVLSGGAAAEQAASIPADEHTLVPHEEQHQGDEDFLHDLSQHGYNGGGQFQDQEDDGHEPGQDYDGNEEEQEFDQADTYDEQQEEYQPDYAPGAEDEQFHTAQDFLNGEYYEHGPEHDVYHDGEDGLDDTVETVVHHAIDEYEEHEATDDFEGDFDFDEAAEQADHSGLHHSTTESLTGKRSFDEHADLTGDQEERDPKKPRAV